MGKWRASFPSDNEDAKRRREPRKGTRGNLQEHSCQWSGGDRLIFTVPFQICWFFSQFSTWSWKQPRKAPSQGSPCERNRYEMRAGWEGSFAIRAMNSEKGQTQVVDDSLHPAPRHCLLRLKISPPAALKGWSPRSYTTYPLYTVLLRCRLGGQGHNEGTQSKQGLRWQWVKWN